MDHSCKVSTIQINKWLNCQSFSIWSKIISHMVLMVWKMYKVKISQQSKRLMIRYSKINSHWWWIILLVSIIRLWAVSLRRHRGIYHCISTLKAWCLHRRWPLEQGWTSTISVLLHRRTQLEVIISTPLCKGTINVTQLQLSKTLPLSIQSNNRWLERDKHRLWQRMWIIQW